MKKSITKNIDILVFGAHPDDAEIFMGGSLLYFKKLKLSTAVCDLTKGELGTYGNASIREKEKENASRLLNLDVRETLDIPDGQIHVSSTYLHKVITVIRELKPKIVFTMEEDSRHPDHSQTHQLVKEACFLSGLKKWNSPLSPHRPGALAYYPEIIFSKKPDFVVDISSVFQEKQKVINAYKSQVIGKLENDSQSQTFIRSHRFWKQLETRSVMAGSFIAVEYGEPFYTSLSLSLTDPLTQLFKKGLH